MADDIGPVQNFHHTFRNHKLENFTVILEIETGQRNDPINPVFQRII